MAPPSTCYIPDVRQALSQLLADFLSSLVFLAIYAATGSLVIATLVAIAVALVQLVRARVRKAPMSLVQWVSLALVILLSSLTLITRDSRFVQLKPSLAYFAIGAAMLKRGWQLPYLPPRALELLSQRMLVGWGYAWAALMIAMGLLNLAAARWLSLPAWGAFISCLLIAKLLFFALQYLCMRFYAARAAQAGR
jgi:intracellular septation protein